MRLGYLPAMPLWSSGHHGLSPLYRKGRLSRHANLNDVMKRGLATAGVPSWLGPLGLDRGGGRRSDGLNLPIQ